ncbi:MAG TPA: methyltransferase domain-containing protein [Gaiellaceae bacterium]|nr:methyltransferase domain-containing protein [Gaiellaceae bacterium]
MSDRYRFSFGRVAEHYERARPPYADVAVDWAIERLGLGAGARVLDLAAGTGRLTRALVERGLDVVAVEPDDGMRAVLVQAVPGVEARAGGAEDIPLPDASVDAVTVGQAFHWFETGHALAEMHRVLRPGGGFALLWNQFNHDDPLLGPVDEFLRARRPSDARRSSWRDRYDGRGFGPLEEHVFDQERPMSVDEVVAWVASTSPVIAAPAEEQLEIEAAVRRLADGHAGVVTIRTDVVVAHALS